jgi:hypothetical protein
MGGADRLPVTAIIGRRISDGVLRNTARSLHTQSVFPVLGRNRLGTQRIMDGTPDLVHGEVATHASPHDSALDHVEARKPPSMRSVFRHSGPMGSRLHLGRRGDCGVLGPLGLPLLNLVRLCRGRVILDQAVESLGYRLTQPTPESGRLPQACLPPMLWPAHFPSPTPMH